MTKPNVKNMGDGIYVINGIIIYADSKKDAIKQFMEQ
jgi:hypothetical protein